MTLDQISRKDPFRMRLANREYCIYPDRGGWDAHYRPINSKTNRPWQAERYVPGKDCYRLWKWNTNTGTSPVGLIKSELKMGKLPDDWSASGEWTGAQTLFSSFDVAFEACHLHAGGKTESVADLIAELKAALSKLPVPYVKPV